MTRGSPGSPGPSARWKCELRRRSSDLARCRCAGTCSATPLSTLSRGAMMNANEVLADLVQTLATWLRDELGELAPEALAWQPDPQGNGIGVTVWHVSRWLDLLAVQILQARPAADEQWQTQGWATRTGYDPRRIGYRGLGAL